MTDLDVALTPAQWEHWARHGWTLTAAPTEPCRTSSCNVPELGDTCAECHPSGVIPVPVTEPCPVCRGSRIDYAVTADGYVSFTCGHCSGSGVVPRTVGIIRPERHLVGWSDYYGRHSNGASDPCPTGRAASCPVCVVIPAERVGTATVTAVPVVDERGWLHDEDTPAEALVVELDDSLVLVSHRHQHDATALFATPPAPGGTVWRLDKENQ